MPIKIAPIFKPKSKIYIRTIASRRKIPKTTFQEELVGGFPMPPKITHSPSKTHDPILTPNKKGLQVKPATLGNYWWAVRELNPRPPVCETFSSLPFPSFNHPKLQLIPCIHLISPKYLSRLESGRVRSEERLSVTISLQHMIPSFLVMKGGPFSFSLPRDTKYLRWTFGHKGGAYPGLTRIARPQDAGHDAAAVFPFSTRAVAECS